MQYEDVSTIRLREFKELLKNLRETEKELQRTLIPQLSRFKSKRLQRLLTYRESG